MLRSKYALCDFFWAYILAELFAAAMLAHSGWLEWKYSFNFVSDQMTFIF